MHDSLTHLTDPPGCVQGSLALDTLQSFVNARRLRTFQQEHRLIPGIQLTCNAEIVKWTVVGLKQNSDTTNPEIHLWRQQSPTSSFYDRIETFELTGPTLKERPGKPNVFDFTSATSITGNSGDVLGLFHPNANDSSLAVYYYEDGDGPLNYARDSNTIFQNLFRLSIDRESGYLYPLVQVETVPGNK